MIAKTKKYIRETQIEWNKVSKPKWEDVKSNTIIVLSATAILGIFLWLIDGNENSPKWTSKGELFGPGIVSLVALIPVIYWTITKAITAPSISIGGGGNSIPKELFAALIALLPLLAVLGLHYLYGEPISGFGIAWLRKMAIQ